ncbi:MAG: pyridoxal 5'-phosphate synthase glutaminase subunit PdxT [Clostridia bacterium]|jgi:5'-phosphate synthase pdxT subunit
MLIGVLALQGSFAEHIKMLNDMGIKTVELRNREDLLLYPIDGLILPGGESTVQGKLLKELGMIDLLRDSIINGLPVLATCAGMILLAQEISNGDEPHFASMPIKIRRNGFGRQIASFHTEGDFKDIGVIPMTFIRAPYVETASDEVEILATINNLIVAVRYKNQIGLSFHPELNNDNRVYRMFLDIAETRKSKTISYKVVASAFVKKV